MHPRGNQVSFPAQLYGVRKAIRIHQGLEIILHQARTTETPTYFLLRSHRHRLHKQAVRQGPHLRACQPAVRVHLRSWS